MISNIKPLLFLQMHYYQPMWTLVGGDLKKMEQSGKPMAQVLPTVRRLRFKYNEISSSLNLPNLSKTLIISHILCLVFKNAEWIKSSVAKFDADKCKVTTANGDEISYEYLVIAVGLQLRFDQVNTTL